MKMTFAVLLYLLQRQGCHLHTAAGADNEESREIQRLRYLKRSSEEQILSDLSDGQKTLYLKDGDTKDSVFMYLSDKSGMPEAHPCCHIKGAAKSQQIFEYLAEQWQELDAWENRLAQSILQHVPFQNILTQGKTYIRQEYALIDRDMNVMFSTPEYHTELANTKEEHAEGIRRLSAELTHSLLMRKDFHEAALKKEGFYFYNHYTESLLYCRNIFLFDQYYARLICRLNKGQDNISRGEAYLIEIFARYIELYFQNNLQTPDRHQNDLLHQLCRSLYADEKPDIALLQTALSPYHWKLGHRYQAAVLKAYQQEEWQTQMEITLPFLVRELERQWPDSCAVSLGNKVLWVINLSLTEQASFFSRFSVFIRENVCRAGISEVFSSISFIHSAALEAEAALRLGSRSNDTFWYYQFEDYRLRYCLETMTKDLPSGRLLHPAVRLLRDRDIQKGTELVPTLRAYLNCGMNMTHAADQLYIHRTTFCRRMEQISHLTGITEFTSDLTLDLLISLKLLEEERN